VIVQIVFLVDPSQNGAGFVGEQKGKNRCGLLTGDPVQLGIHRFRERSWLIPPLQNVIWEHRKRHQSVRAKLSLPVWLDVECSSLSALRTPPSSIMSRFHSEDRPRDERPPFFEGQWQVNEKPAQHSRRYLSFPRNVNSNHPARNPISCEIQTRKESVNSPME